VWFQKAEDQVCSLCRDKSGACIQCDNKSCFTAFHVTCARQVGLLQGMKSMNTDSQLRAFCHKHLPVSCRLWLKTDAHDQPDAEGVDLDDDMDSDYGGTPAVQTGRKQKSGAVTSKSARAHTKSYRPEPPIVPHMIVQNVLDYVSRIVIRKKQPFVERLCRYWSLKREARRGAPLLKRLHLEVRTESGLGNKRLTE
jgi:NuA3 HAT complex component NTO1